MRRIWAKRLAACLGEVTFRFNERVNPNLFRDTRVKLIAAPVLEDKTSLLGMLRLSVNLVSNAKNSIFVGGVTHHRACDFFENFVIV